MRDKIEVLIVPQHSHDLENAVRPKTAPGHTVWCSNGRRVKYPIGINHAPTRWVQHVEYPAWDTVLMVDGASERLTMVDPDSGPAWGSAWYVKNHRDECELFRSNWDSSD